MKSIRSNKRQAMHNGTRGGATTLSMPQKFLQVVLALVLALAYAIPTSALTAAKAYADDGGISHGTIAIASADAADDVITVSVGETATVSVTPYQHVQYTGCCMVGACPEVCSDQPVGECFIEGKGCVCDNTPLLRTAAVTTSVADDSVATASDVTASAELVAAANTVGNTNTGAITVTGVKEGTTTVTVAAAAAAQNDTAGMPSDVLHFWNGATKTYTVNVVASAPEPQPSIEGLQSAHPYADNADETLTYTWNGAGTYGLAVTFDEQTNVEDGCDYIYVMDGNGFLVGKYTGAQLAGKTVYVLQSDTVKIRMTSDKSGAEWGYKVASIAAMTENNLAEHAVIAPVSSQSCAEGPATPDPVVTYGEKTLVKGTDYTVSHSNNNAAGEGTVTVTGIGDYVGSLSAKFLVYDTALATPSAFTGYSIRCYNTQSSGTAMNNGQRVEYTLHFDGQLSVNNEEYLASSLVLDSRLKGYTASIGADGKSLVLDCVLGFALTDGRFWLKSLYADGDIAGLLVSKDGVVSQASMGEGLYALINSGLAIEVVEQVRGTATTPASTTYRITNPSPVRGMHHMAWTSNGTSILSGTPGYGQTTVAHQHQFFNMDPAETIVSNAVNPLKAAGYTITRNIPEGGYSRNPDVLSTFTVTADACTMGEIIDAYVYDDAFLQKYDMTLDTEIKGLPYTPDSTQPSIEGLESAHEYANYTDETKTYTWAGNAYGFAVTFDERTATEARYDFVYVMDGKDNVIGKYSGTELAGKTVYVPQTDTVKIRLTSDRSGTDWGYKVTSISVLSGNDLTKCGAIEAIVPQFLPEGEGAACTPDLVVTYGNATLVKGTDYTVSYTNNMAVGTATAKVTGIGAYKGSISAEFAVVDKDHLLEPVAAVTADQKTNLRQVGDRDYTSVRFSNVTDAWMKSISKVTVAPVDNGVVGESLELSADQFKATSSGITIYRTEDVPVFTVIPGQNPIDIVGWRSTNTYPQSRVYQVTVEANGYSAVVGNVTFYTGTAVAFSIIIDEDGNSQTTDDRTIAASWTAQDLANLSQFKFANGSSQCGMTGFRTFSGYGVSLEDLLAIANVSVSPSDSFLIDTSDHYGNKQTYESLFGSDRYFLQSIYDDQEVKDTYARLVQDDDEAGALIELRRLLAEKALEDNSVVKPMISTGYVESLIYGDEVASAVLPTKENTDINTLVGIENQYRFIYGIRLIQEDVKVTFDTQGGSDVATQTVKSHLMTSTENTTMSSSYWANSLVIYRNAGKGVTPSTATDTIAVPENPTRDGYVFLGWYTDKECTEGNEFDFNTNDGTVDAATTLYAKWGEAPVSLSAQDDEVIVGESFTVDVKVTMDELAAFDKTVVSYDSSALRLVGIEKGAGLSEDAKFMVTDNGFSFYGNEADTSEGLVVATLTFEALKATDKASISIGDVVKGGKSVNPKDIELLVEPFAGINVVLPTMLGDANNSGMVSIVDAQVVYDLAAGKYGTDWAKVVSAFGEKATKATVASVADVSADGEVESADAFAIQRYVHLGTFGEE